MNHAAMYVRVSSQHQKEDATIESQIVILHKFANQKKYAIPPNWIFRDDGVSGATLNRPALEKLRDLIYEGVINTIFILSPDRLARSYPHQAILMEEFAKFGANVIFQNAPSQETPQDKLLLQIQGMFAEYERAQIMERSRRGKKHKAKSGCVSVLGTAPYGYRYIRANLASEAYYEIVDHEAKIVRLIFDLYTKERLSLYKIRTYLHSQKIRSPKGNEKWDTTSISNILKNSSYRGLAFYGKRESCEPNPNRLTSRRLRSKNVFKPNSGSRKRPKSEWIGIQVPSIIDDDTYELAHELLKKNILLSTRNAKLGSLLQGLIVCKECGYGFKRICSGKASEGYVYYRCGTREKKCGNRSLRVNDIDNVIWQSIVSMLENPELIKKEVSRRVSELKKEPLQLKIKQLKEKQNKIENENNRLLDAYQEGCVNLEVLKKRVQEINREKNRIKRELNDLDSNMCTKELLNLEESIGYFSRKIRENEENLNIGEKRKILRMLIRDIEVGKDEIIVNHIIPSIGNPSFSKIACLPGSCVRVLRG